MGPIPEKDSVTTLGFQYVASYWNNPVTATQIIKEISHPYDTGTSMNLLLKSLDNILAIADSCGLKVILVPSTGKLAQSPDAVDDVANYLKVYAAHFADNPAILAYDLYNEPIWVDNLKHFDPAYDHNKYEVCQYVKSWYDSVKLGDPNHLVTMGLCTFNDVIEWDPGIMKLDFISEHLYPNMRPEEHYNIDTAMIRYRDELIWTARNVPIPWIVGETGFSGTDYQFPPFNVAPHTDTAYTHPPYVWGSIADQKAFADTVIQLVRDCGASGISWWQFQDTFWGQRPDSTPPAEYKESFFGILNSGNWSSGSGYEPFRKSTVESFQQFDPSIPPGEFPDQTAMFYNPFNFSQINRDTISGTVLNYYSNQPVKDAFLILWSKIYLHKTFRTSAFTSLYKHYTFTDPAGAFVAYPAPDNLQPSTIDDMKISVPGFERVERGWSSPYNSSNLGCTDGEIFYLKGTGWQYDAIIADETISYGQIRNYQGWNSLSVSDLVVQSGGISDLSARTEIDLLNTFDAFSGSEVYVFIAQTFPECNDFSTFLKGGTLFSIVEKEPAMEIEISFGKSNDSFDFSLYPNPTTGITILQIENHLPKSSFVKIIDMAGIVKIERELVESIMDIDISGYSKGIYLVQVCYENIVINKKLILQ